MNMRNELPDYPAGPGHRGGETSRAGALKVYGDGSAKTQTAAVLRAIEAAGEVGATAAEIFEVEPDKMIDLHRVRSRISPLVRDGKVADSGRTRDGGFGVMVKVWVAARYAPPVADDGQTSLFGSAAT